MRNLGRGLILGGSVLFVAASGCTVITDVDRSKIQDDAGVSGSAGSAGAPAETGGSVSAGTGGLGGAEGGAAGSAGAPPATGGSQPGGAAGAPGGEGGGAGSPAGAAGTAGGPGGASGAAGSPGGEGGGAGSPAGAAGVAGAPGGEGGAAGGAGVAGSPAGAGGVAGSQAGAGGGAGSPPSGTGGAQGGGAGQAGAGGGCADTQCGTVCVNLQTNANHCGECDYLCSEINASSTACSSGACVPVCNTGYRDCNAISRPDPDDGCETWISDPTACGNCSTVHVCSTDHVVGTPTCSTDGNGYCTAAECDVGWADCTHPGASVADNGCETNVYTSTANCGACNRACNGANVAATSCTDGLCDSECNSGFGNCTQPAAPDPDNGCETNLNTAANDCGECDHICAGGATVQTRVCDNGVCAPVCNSPNLDCNTPATGTADDGCETNGNSVDSCGANCASVKICSTNNVATRSCNSGVCSPTCLSGYLNCSADEHAANDGCETPNATAASCGTACGSLYACDTTNASSAACSGGTCQLTCNTGFLDCNATQNSTGDGCETPNNTVASCGSDCNNLRTCSTANTDSVTCPSGLCNLTCSAGFLDCSDDEDVDLDGCETDEAALDWDETQCGTGCGDLAQCDTGAGELCLQGSCETGAILVGPGETYTTIQDAIDSVPDAGTATIVVRPGDYTEDLSIINKAITLLSDDGPGSVTIIGVQKSLASEFPLARPNIDIQADDVVIDGFVIESPVLACGPEAEYSSGIVLTGRNIEILNNAFYVGTADVSQGIQTYKDDNAPVGLRDITGLYIHDNTFSDNGPCSGGTGTPLNAYEGIYLNTQSDAVVDQSDAVSIQDNTFGGALLRAVTTERYWMLFSGNTVTSTWSDAAFEDVYPNGVNAQADHVAVVGNVLTGLESAVRVGTLASLSADGSIYMIDNCLTGNDVAARFDGTANGHIVIADQNWWGADANPVACDGPPNGQPNCVFPEFSINTRLSTAPAICP